MKSKQTYLFLVLITSALACTKTDKPGFTISGHIEGIEDGYAYLQETSPDGLLTIDSSVITDGNYSFSGTTKLPEVHYLKINQSNKYIVFFLENSKISIQSHIDSLYKSTITGSECQSELDNFYSEIDPFKKKLKSLYKEYYKAEKAEDEAKMKEIDMEYERIHLSQISHMKSYAISNPSSVVASYVSARYLANELDYSSLDTLYNGFLTNLDNTKYIAKLKDRLAILENVAVGKPAIEIVHQDTSHQLIPLSSFRGKVVLIEFWASWCTSCSEINKELKTIYLNHKNKGFEIFGVSLDNDHVKWVESVKDNELPWVNVSDLKGWQSDTRKLYGVIQTPHNILINREGIIVAKDVYGDLLVEELKKLKI